MPVPLSKAGSDPRVLVSVVNWNGRDRTLACLDALSRQSYENRHIMVIDNQSSDGSVEAIRRAYPSVDVIEAGGNVGYAAGHVLAARRAVGESFDLLWILNNDTLAATDALAALVHAHRLHGNAIYGSASFAAAHRSLDARQRPLMMPVWELKPNGEPDYRRLLLNQIHGARFAGDAPLEVASVMGNSMLIPVPIIAQFGFMDASYFLYWEEVDYCFRLRQSGLRSYIVPDSHVFHELEQAHKHDPCLKPVITYYNVRNRLLWTRKYRGRVHFYRAVAASAAFTVLRYLAPLRQGRRAVPVATWATRGILDALRGRWGKTVAPEAFCRTSPANG